MSQITLSSNVQRWPWTMGMETWGQWYESEFNICVCGCVYVLYSCNAYALPLSLFVLDSEFNVCVCVCVCEWVCVCMLWVILSIVPFGFGLLPPLGQEGLLIIADPLKLLIWWGGWAWHVLLRAHYVLHTKQPTSFNTDTRSDAPTSAPKQQVPAVWQNQWFRIHTIQM